MAVVVGYVPTPEGHAALHAARQEAKDRHQKLVVINSHKGGVSFDGDEAIRTEEELEAVRAELAAAGCEFEVMTLVRGNDPTDDLIEVAEEVGATLIVIGLRRRSPIGKLVLGSNAQRILLEADCPVLSVKAPRAR
ncbi:universal stress protein [Nostocoides sp. F2B08]|uniref:universal stress protein n=1 Tax=Nostocoides sp. F2B08 TaxID=2653936 RepID=UPI001263BB6C|nr:universal stress protein [Tetrasphaera sp. F2B08]KAB7742952.1 universal stress protein [Tetrasphaera sp. F2B08]